MNTAASSKSGSNRIILQFEQKLRRNDIHPAFGLAELARRARHEGKFQLALSLYERSLEDWKGPVPAELREEYVQTLFNLSAYKKALKAAEEILKEHPSRLSAVALRAHCRKAAGDWQGAANDFEYMSQNLSAAEFWKYAFNGLGMDKWIGPRISREEKWKKTERVLTEFLRKNPSHFWARVWKAESLLKIKWCEEAARENARLAIKQRSDLTWLSLFLAQTEWASGDYPRALEQFNRLEKTFKNPPPQFYAWRGESRFFTGDASGAVKDFNQAVKTAPVEQKDEFRTWRATLQLWRGHYRKALADCDSVLQRNPLNGQALCWKAAALFKLGKNKQALELLRRSWSVDSDNTEILAWECEILRTSGLHKEAMDVMKRSACQCDPRMWLEFQKFLIGCEEKSTAVMRQSLQALDSFPLMRKYMDWVAWSLKLPRNYLNRPEMAKIVGEKVLKLNLGNRSHFPSPLYLKSLIKPPESLKRALSVHLWKHRIFPAR